MQIKQVDGNKVIFSDKKIEKQKQRQSRLAVFDDKKAKGKLTLEDINDKLDIIVEMLEDLIGK